jgi:hypothetical protein
MHRLFASSKTLWDIVLNVSASSVATKRATRDDWYVLCEASSRDLVSGQYPEPFASSMKSASKTGKEEYPSVSLQSLLAEDRGGDVEVTQTCIRQSGVHEVNAKVSPLACPVGAFRGYLKVAV